VVDTTVKYHEPGRKARIRPAEGAAFGVAVFSAVAVVASGGIGAGYRRGFVIAAAIAAALALLAAVTVPVVRPAAGTRLAMH
jgi:hypothetical protein